MNGYLLDTHVLLWWLNEPEKIRTTARKVIANAESTVLVSAAAGWEIGIKSGIGHLVVPDNLIQSIHQEGIAFLPVTFKHGIAVRHLPTHHQDPFDRIMVAQAQEENLTLVTRDAMMQQYDVALLKA